MALSNFLLSTLDSINYTKVDDDNDDYVYTMNVIAGDEIYFFSSRLLLFIV